MVGEWKTVKMQLDSRLIRLLKQEDFYWAITLTYFVENCRYLRNEDISKVLVILFPKINQFAYDKRFMWQKRFAEMGIYPSQPAFTCSKLTIETIEQVVRYVQS